MPLYSCKYCKFNTPNKYDYKRHLKTQKHIKNIYSEENIGYKNIDKNTKKQMTQNDPKMTQNDPKMTQNDPKMTQLETKEFRCIYCSNSFSTKAHKRRHEIHRCKYSNNFKLEIKKVNKDRNKMLKQFRKEKDKLYKQIEMLIEKAGDTTNNITNNIQINSYGQEDTSYITEKMLNRLVVHPNTMIADLVKLTHFHKDHPENKNLKITNIKSKYLKVFSKGKWTLQNKDIVIDNIMAMKSNILEEHFDDKCKEILPEYQQNRFNNFIEILDEQPSLQKKIKDNIELTIANGY